MSRAQKLFIVALGLGTAVTWYSRVSARPPTGVALVSNDPGSLLVSRAKRAERSGVLIETSGFVTDIIPPAAADSSEQRLLLRLTPDLTIPIVHRLRTAEPVPAHIGDRIRVRGWYHWNEEGGVLLGSHTDAAGVEREGWILHRGRFYAATNTRRIGGTGGGPLTD